ncbi:hypothetical protein BZA77DRAFT_295559 [Pyronema omphalodes]|nr:hypothetical protein BZA77DRAFT_295559 [Pyronema omphalodes]
MDHHPLLIPENIVPLKFSLSPHSVPPDIWYGLSIFPGFTLWILLDKFLQFVFPQYSNFRIRNALKDLHNIPMTPFERTLTIILNSILPLIFVFQTLFIMSKQLGIPNPPNPFSGTTKEDIINEIIILGEYLLGAGVVMIGRYAQSRYWEWILWSFRLLERLGVGVGVGVGKSGENGKYGRTDWGCKLVGLDYSRGRPENKRTPEASFPNLTSSHSCIPKPKARNSTTTILD